MIQVSDAGETLKTYLQSSAVQSIIFGAGQSDDANSVVGTIDPDDITHDSDTSTTTIPVEITAEQKAGAVDGLAHVPRQSDRRRWRNSR